MKVGLVLQLGQYPQCCPPGPTAILIWKLCASLSVNPPKTVFMKSRRPLKRKETNQILLLSGLTKPWPQLGTLRSPVIKKIHYNFKVLSKEHIIFQSLLSSSVALNKEMIQQQQKKQEVTWIDLCGFRKFINSVTDLHFPGSLRKPFRSLHMLQRHLRNIQVILILKVRWCTTITTDKLDASHFNNVRKK